MLSFLAILPKALVTFLYALAALLRFYGNTDSTPFPGIGLTLQQWSLLAFGLGSMALVVNLGLEWHAGNRATNERARAKDEADQERDRAAEEREQTARRARIQTRCTILQIRYQLDPNPTNREALRDFLFFLEEYGD